VRFRTTSKVRGVTRRSGATTVVSAVVLALLLGLVLPAVARAADPPPEPLGVGDTLPELPLTDQHGAQHVVDASVKIILFSRDMDGGDILKSALADLPEGSLDAAGAVYVSDISGMPSFVARLFALPRMRRRPYPMLLDRTGEVTVLLPDEPGRATLIHLDALQITEVEHLETPEAVRARLVPADESTTKAP